ncbi:Lipopolysaccharide binding protein [Operophtera brumata]|uniref:Lipopolysaccharide binding protein n=1 Tax=Operophtera brumata TaxID=104452 RepID=A0A0L7LUC3_OPEBR|nr:Lipopolysaccharide binding protein [Operophtera brumata]
MIWFIFFISLLVSKLCHVHSGKEFRYDYKFSDKAEGWLKLHQVPATWMEARLRCHAEGSVLASPLTNQLKSAIIDHVREVRKKPTTIFTRRFPKGTTFLLKLPLEWAPGEPDNYLNSESCLVMLTQSNGTVGDVMCSDVFPYVCYKKKTTLVLTECGTHDTEYNLDARTGSCYKFHRRGLPWSRAYMTCAAEGAHLAIINSAEESQVLKDLYAKNPDNVIFSKDPYVAAIGFHDWGERGSWMTIHGETLKQAGFDRFKDGEPNNSTHSRTGDDGEYCGSIVRSGNLNDVWCNVHIPFICEKKPDSLFQEFEDH